MADLGIASRRHSAELVAEGRVRVDGKLITEAGFRVENPLETVVSVDGRDYTFGGRAKRSTTVMLNKPRGFVCASSDAHEPTVFECLRGIDERLVCCGRLDKNSGGLLILSDDGNLTNRLTHPQFGHEKIYMATVRGWFSQEVLDFLNSPIKMDGYTTRPARVEYIERLPDDYYGTLHQLRVTLGEGRNRQIRNMCEQAGLSVVKLIRIAINGLCLPRDLREGEWRYLTEKDLEKLNP